MGECTKAWYKINKVYFKLWILQIYSSGVQGCYSRKSDVVLRDGCCHATPSPAFEFARQQSPQALPMSPLMTIDHKALMTHADLQLV